MGGIRLVRRTGQISLNMKAAADAMGKAVDLMRENIRHGVDGDGGALPGYSSLYKLQLAAIGESGSVDMTRSGRLLADLRVLEVQIDGPRLTLVFGAGESTSPRPPRPPPWCFIGTPAQRAKALERWRASPKKVTQSEPHSKLLARLQQAAGRRPARKLLGMPPAMRAEIVKALEQAKIFSYG